MSDNAQHPRPSINRDFAFLYEGYRDRKLLIQKCRQCGALRHPPGPFCPTCHSYEWDTLEASDRGKLHSYTVHHYPPIPPWPVPHVIALADMADGFRFVAAIPDADPASLAIGQPLRIAFAEVEPGYVLPHFEIEDFR